MVQAVYRAEIGQFSIIEMTSSFLTGCMGNRKVNSSKKKACFGIESLSDDSFLSFRTERSGERNLDNS